MQSSLTRTGVLGRPSISRTTEDLVPREVLDVLIRRECARADRNEREFSLVLFRLPNSKRNAVSTQRLVRTILARARMTDEVGWFSAHYLCALLPDTSARGAQAFSDGVCEMAAQKGSRPATVVYSYPGNWSTDAAEPVAASAGLGRRDRFSDEDDDDNDPGSRPNGNGRVDGNGNGSGHSGGNGQATAARTRGEGVTREDLLPVFAQGLVAELADGSAPTESIVDLLVHPLPAWKRALDILGALLAMVLLSPVMVIAAIGIKLTSKGPIIFKQDRAGLGGRPFKIYKFRTMVTDAEARKRDLRKYSEQDGPAFKLSNDPRITGIGHFLRKTSIDELPQLWNIVRGDMSLVGPRPLPVEEANKCTQWQRRRLDVTPGLTCIWQVRGRSRVTFADWVRMDVEYIRRRTLFHDISLLAQTIPAVLMRRGAR